MGGLEKLSNIPRERRENELRERMLGAQFENQELQNQLLSKKLNETEAATNDVVNTLSDPNAVKAYQAIQKVQGASFDPAKAVPMAQVAGTAMSTLNKAVEAGEVTEEQKKEIVRSGVGNPHNPQVNKSYIDNYSLGKQKQAQAAQVAKQNHAKNAMWANQAGLKVPEGVDPSMPEGEFRNVVRNMNSPFRTALQTKGGQEVFDTATIRMRELMAKSPQVVQAWVDSTEDGVMSNTEFGEFAEMAGLDNGEVGPSVLSAIKGQIESEMKEAFVKNQVIAIERGDEFDSMIKSKTMRRGARAAFLKKDGDVMLPEGYTHNADIVNVGGKPMAGIMNNGILHTVESNEDGTEILMNFVDVANKKAAKSGVPLTDQAVIDLFKNEPVLGVKELHNYSTDVRKWVTKKSKLGGAIGDRAKLALKFTKEKDLIVSRFKSKTGFTPDMPKELDAKEAVLKNGQLTLLIPFVMDAARKQ